MLRWEIKWKLLDFRGPVDEARIKLVRLEFVSNGQVCCNYR